MSRHRIYVRIHPTGEISVEAEGFRGNGCEAATKAIEEALGKPVSRTRKPEYRGQTRCVQHEQTLGEGGSAT
jgi:hypothetical protein